MCLRISGVGKEGSTLSVRGFSFADQDMIIAIEDHDADTNAWNPEEFICRAYRVGDTQFNCHMVLQMG